MDTCCWNSFLYLMIWWSMTCAKHHLHCVSLGSSTLPQFFCGAVNHWMLPLLPQVLVGNRLREIRNHNLWRILRGAWMSTICRSIVYFVNLDTLICSAQAWNGTLRSVANLSLSSSTLTYHSLLETLKVTMVSVDIPSFALKELHNCAEHASVPSRYLDIQRPAIMPIANATVLTSMFVTSTFRTKGNVLTAPE